MSTEENKAIILLLTGEVINRHDLPVIEARRLAYAVVERSKPTTYHGGLA